uniref:Uncharacterized protein n=1 Tax=Cyanoptyche gloeocystis TaxID=77922 RepID=A0A7S2JPU1_9EUKA
MRLRSTASLKADSMSLVTAPPLLVLLSHKHDVQRRGVVVQQLLPDSAENLPLALEMGMEFPLFYSGVRLHISQVMQLPLHNSFDDAAPLLRSLFRIEPDSAVITRSFAVRAGRAQKSLFAWTSTVLAKRLLLLVPIIYFIHQAEGARSWLRRCDPL